MRAWFTAALVGLVFAGGVHAGAGVLNEPIAPAAAAASKVVEPEPAKSGLDRIIDASEEPEVIARGHRFTEGPVWVPAAGPDRPGFLLYSDIAQNTIHRLDVGTPGAEAEVWLSPSGRANGLTLDREGRVLIAMHDGRVARRSARAASEEAAETLCERFEGKGLNSPNDLVASPDGTIYFTDPPYGLRPPLGAEGRERELDFCGVFRLAPDGTLTLEHREMPAPNGVALSPDGRRLYVADTGTGRIFAFEVNKDGSLGEPVLFATNDTGGRRTFADGLRVDVEGNLYAAGPGGVWVYDDKGKHLGTIPMPNAPTNLCFGGEDRRTLFATTRDSVCSVRVKIAGLPAATRLERSAKPE